MQIEICCAVEKMAHLIESSGDLFLMDITPVTISEYETRRRAKEESQRTINYKLTLMIHPFNITMKE